MWLERPGQVASLLLSLSPHLLQGDSGFSPHSIVLLITSVKTYHIADTVGAQKIPALPTLPCAVPLYSITSFSLILKLP